MGDPHQIMHDTEFWHILEYAFPDRFQDAEGEEVKGVWCDGIAPLDISDTKYGVEVLGMASIIRGERYEDFMFKAKVPQKLLYKPIRQFDVDITAFEPNQNVLELTVFPKRSENDG